MHITVVHGWPCRAASSLQEDEAKVSIFISSMRLSTQEVGLAVDGDLQTQDMVYSNFITGINHVTS